MDAHFVCVDVESYYDPQCTLSRDKLNYFEYLGHPLYELFGGAVSVDGADPVWMRPRRLLGYLSTLILRSRVVLVGHNAVFDVLSLKKLGVPVEKAVLLSCTQSMSRYFSPGRSASLSAAAERFTSGKKGLELAMFKGLRWEEMDDAQRTTLGNYCVNDTVLCRDIYKRLSPKLPVTEKYAIDQSIRMVTEPALDADRDLMEELLEEEKEEAKKIIAKGGVPVEVLRSNVKFQKYLDDIGIPAPMKRNAKGKLIPAFGKNDAGWSRLKSAFPEHTDLFNARERSKSRLTETRLERFMGLADLCDQKMPVMIKYGAAHTLRFGGYGGLNQQNLPRTGRLRNVMKAPDGYKLVVADYNAIECRVIAWLSHCKALLNAFVSGGNPYTEFGKAFYNRVVDKKTEPTYYMFCKMVVLGLQYGMSGNRLSVEARELLSDPNQAHRAHATYKQLYWQIPQFWRDLESSMKAMLSGQSMTVGYLKTEPVLRAVRLPSGRVMEWPDLRFNETSGDLVFSDNRGASMITKRIWGGSATENVTQAVARDLLVYAMYLVNQEYPRAKLVLHAHDELAYLVKTAEARAFLKLLLSLMERQVPWAPGLPLKAEGSVEEVYGK